MSRRADDLLFDHTALQPLVPRRLLLFLVLYAGFVNVTSLTKHIVSIRQFLRERPTFRLFAIAESRLSPEVESTLVEIEDFSLSGKTELVMGAEWHFTFITRSKLKS